MSCVNNKQAISATVKIPAHVLRTGLGSGKTFPGPKVQVASAGPPKTFPKGRIIGAFYTWWELQGPRVLATAKWTSGNIGFHGGWKTQTEIPGKFGPRVVGTGHGTSWTGLGPRVLADKATELLGAWNPGVVGTKRNRNSLGNWTPGVGGNRPNRNFLGQRLRPGWLQKAQRNFLEVGQSPAGWVGPKGPKRKLSLGRFGIPTGVGWGNKGQKREPSLWKRIWVPAGWLANKAQEKPTPGASWETPGGLLGNNGQNAEPPLGKIDIHGVVCTTRPTRQTSLKKWEYTAGLGGQNTPQQGTIPWGRDREPPTGWLATRQTGPLVRRGETPAGVLGKRGTTGPTHKCWATRGVGKKRAPSTHSVGA